MLALVNHASRRSALTSFSAATAVFTSSPTSDTCTADSGQYRVVCILDPKFLWSGEAEQSGNAQSAERTHMYTNIPNSLIDQLSTGRFRLGDADDPESTWTVGGEGELFEYRFLGAHTVQSGCTAIIRSTPQMAETSALPPLPESVKAELREAITKYHVDKPYQNGDVLFMGSLVDAAAASVYLHKQGTSLMISSSHEGLF